MWMLTALTRMVLTNALNYKAGYNGDRHSCSGTLIFIIKDDHEYVFPLTVLAHPYARSHHDCECSNKAEFIVMT